MSPSDFELIRPAAATDELCVNTIRFLAVDAVQQARSGHPGLPLGSAAMAYVLWDRFLKFNPRDPYWPDRDRFVLSADHGCMMLYALLHLYGFEVPLEEIQRFRQWGSITPGHPEYGKTPGVEATTGPLGQGFANAVGMAIAETALAARFNRPGYTLVDHYTYVVAGDGDLMEGVSAEAASLAGHLQLGKLIVLYDDNHISIEGSTKIAFTEDVLGRFSAYHWHVQRLKDGNDVREVTEAIVAAQEETDRPSLIAVRTQVFPLNVISIPAKEEEFAMMLKGKKVALLVEDLYQELEVWYPLLRFREEGAEVTVVGSGSAKEHTSKFGYPVQVDKFAHEVKADQFDAVVIPGGYAPDLMRRYPGMVSLVREAARQDKVVAAICHGGWMLASAEVIQGKTVTGFFAIKDDLVHAGAKFVDEEVVVDGKIVTSRKPEDLPAFCQAIITALGGALECPSCHAVIYSGELWD